MRTGRDAGSSRTTSSGRKPPTPPKPKSPPPPKSYIKRTQGPSTPAETLERKQAASPVAGPPLPGRTLVRNAEARTHQAEVDRVLNRRRRKGGLGTSERAKSIQQGQIQRGAIDPSGLWFIKHVLERPTLGALELAARPQRAVAGSLDDIVTGHPTRVFKSTGRALAGKEKRGFKDVLEHAGVHGPIADIAGFAGDVATDPLTYATFGTASVARHAGEKAAAKALAEGASKEEAASVAAKAMEGLPTNKGLQAGFRLHVPTVRKGEVHLPKGRKKDGLPNSKAVPVPALGRKTIKAQTSGKATAKLNKALGGSAAATKVREAKVVQEAGKVFAPDFRPKGVTPEEFDARRIADRVMRAKVHTTEREAANTQEAFRKEIPKKDRAIVADAIERAPENLPGEEGRFKRLLAEGNQRIAARDLNDQERYVFSVMPQPDAEAVRLSRKEYESNLDELDKMIRRGDNPIGAQELARQVSNAEAYLKYHEALDAGRHAHATTEPGPRVTPALSGHPEAVHEAARRFEGMWNEERARGLHSSAEPVPNYLPHQHPDNVEHDVRKEQVAGEADLPEGYVRQHRGARFGFDKQRQYQGSVKEINDRMGEEVFSRSVPDLIANRELRSGQKIARVDFHDALASTGKQIEPHSAELFMGPKDGYGFYVRDKKGNLKLASETELKDFREGRSIGGTLHMLNVVNTEGALKQFDAVVNRNPVWMRKIVNLWKTGFTVVQPSYHIGNFIGDMTMAWEADAAIAANFPAAWRAVRLHALWQKYQRSSTAARHGIEGFEMGLSKGDYALFKLLREAEDHGALQTGFFGTEARMLTGKSGGKLRRFSEHRENLPRMVTYMSARQEGMTADQAARWTNKHHIDYGDLTPWERRIRDSPVGIPFYTFFARNTRLQATKLLERPGKAANFQLAREDSADASGESKTFDRILQTYQQAGAPFMVRVNGTHVLFYPRTPVEQGLQNLTVLGPAGKGDFGDQFPIADQIGSRLNPVVKIPMELWQNRSFFMRNDISSVEDNTKELPAPKYVAGLEGTPIGDWLGVKRHRDGKLTWSGTADYVTKQIPGGRPATDLFAEGPNRFGQSKTQTALSTAGFKTGPYNKEQLKARKESQEFFDLKDWLKQVKKNGDWQTSDGGPTDEYIRKNLRYHDLLRNYKLRQLDQKP